MSQENETVIRNAKWLVKIAAAELAGLKREIRITSRCSEKWAVDYTNKLKNEVDIKQLEVKSRKTALKEMIKRVA